MCSGRHFHPAARLRDRTCENRTGEGQHYRVASLNLGRDHRVPTRSVRIAGCRPPLPSSRETPSEPFGRPSFLPEALGPGEALAGALGDQVALDLGKQRDERGHDLRLDVALALEADVLLERHEGDAGLDERVEDGHDLRRRFRRFLQQRHVSVQTEQMHPAVDTAGDVPRDDLHGSGSQVTEGVLSDAGRFFLHRPTPRSARSRW